MRPARPPYASSALEAIGRNVVNFQRLERCLKSLSVLTPIVLTPETAQTALERRTAAKSRLTLGQAMSEWIQDSLAPPASKLPPLPKDTTSVSFAFRLESVEEEDARLARDLQALVTERNDLVHVTLATVNFDSESECRVLVEALDAQNVRINQALDFFGSMLKDLRESLQWLASEEGINTLVAQVGRADGQGSET
jgi:dynactin complex subunit